MNQQENFFLRLLDKLNSLSADTLFVITLWIVLSCLGMTIVGVHFAPSDSDPNPVSPVMQILRRSLYNTSNSDPDLKKYYIEKLLELEEKESSQRQVVIYQIAPITSQDISEK